jgi:hypothetical protein
MSIADQLADLIMSGATILLAIGGAGARPEVCAAPMVAGSSPPFLTLEMIPVIYTYWRHEQLLWKRLAIIDPVQLGRMQFFTAVQSLAASALLRSWRIRWKRALVITTSPFCAG